jgi:hypothetical protein
MLAKKKKQLKAAATAVYAMGQMAKGASEAATPIKDRPLLHRLLEDGMVLIMLVCLLGVLWLDLHLPAWFAAWLRSLGGVGWRTTFVALPCGYLARG